MNEQFVIVFSNVISGLGMLVLFISTFLRDKRQILGVQCVNHACAIVADTLLKGYSGLVQDVISLTRNLVVLAGRQTRFLKVFFVAAGLLLGMAFNNRGLVGLLPVLAGTEYAIVVVREGTTERALKWAIVVSTLCWAIYSVVLLNFVSGAANLATMLSALIYLFKNPKPAGPADKA
ncbi:MAG: YgjV family protein [Faecalibacterium sp.]|jgi:hypothetical protein|nr:YgjV family protein [Faecalibacterium sp.]